MLTDPFPAFLWRFCPSSRTEGASAIIAKIAASAHFPCKREKTLPCRSTCQTLGSTTPLPNSPISPRPCTAREGWRGREPHKAPRPLPSLSLPLLRGQEPPGPPKKPRPPSDGTGAAASPPPGAAGPRLRLREGGRERGKEGGEGGRRAGSPQPRHGSRPGAPEPSPQVGREGCCGRAGGCPAPSRAPRGGRGGAARPAGKFGAGPAGLRRRAGRDGGRRGGLLNGSGEPYLGRGAAPAAGSALASRGRSRYFGVLCFAGWRCGSRERC